MADQNWNPGRQTTGAMVLITTITAHPLRWELGTSFGHPRLHTDPLAPSWLSLAVGTSHHCFGVSDSCDGLSRTLSMFLGYKTGTVSFIGWPWSLYLNCSWCFFLRSDKNLWESVLSFHCMGSRDWTRVLVLGGKRPYPLGHLAGARSFLKHI